MQQVADKTQKDRTGEEEQGQEEWEINGPIDYQCA